MKKKRLAERRLDDKGFIDNFPLDQNKPELKPEPDAYDLSHQNFGVTGEIASRLNDEDMRNLAAYIRGIR